MRIVRTFPWTALLPTLLLLLLGAATAAPARADAACVESCATTYWSCSDACGAFGGALCEQNCTDAYNACVTYCSHCPSYRDYTTIVVNSTTFDNVSPCLKNSANGDSTGRPYRQYTSHQTHYHWRETTQCDTSKSTQLLSTTTANPTCWLLFGSGSCSPFTAGNFYGCP